MIKFFVKLQIIDACGEKDMSCKMKTDYLPSCSTQLKNDWSNTATQLRLFILRRDINLIVFERRI